MFAPTLATLIVVSAMNAPEPTLQWDCFPLRYVPVAVLLMPVVLHAVMLLVAVAVSGGVGLPLPH